MRLIIVLSAVLFSQAAFSATVYKNESLGFSMAEYPREANIAFCSDADGNCLEFEPIEFDGNQETYELCSATACTKYLEARKDAPVRRFKEVSGKCELEIEHKNFDFGGFMFRMGLNIVRVTKGTKDCQLKAHSGPRQLFGIYR